MSKNKLRLGSVVKDTMTPFEGTVVAITDFIYGCRRIMVCSSQLGQDGKPVMESFDEPQLVEVDKRTLDEDVVDADESTGGIRDLLAQRPSPGRRVGNV